MKKMGAVFVACGILSSTAFAEAGDVVFRGSPHVILDGTGGVTGGTTGSGGGTPPGGGVQNEAGGFSVVGNTVKAKADKISLTLVSGMVRSSPTSDEPAFVGEIQEIPFDIHQYVSMLGSFANSVDSGTAIVVSPSNPVPDANGYYTYDLAYTPVATYAPGTFQSTGVPTNCGRFNWVENGYWTRTTVRTMDYTFTVTTLADDGSRTWVMPTIVRNEIFKYTRCDVRG
jgi:hypothetical protein